MVSLLPNTCQSTTKAPVTDAAHTGTCKPIAEGAYAVESAPKAILQETALTETTPSASVRRTSPDHERGPMPASPIGSAGDRDARAGSIT